MSSAVDLNESKSSISNAEDCSSISYALEQSLNMTGLDNIVDALLSSEKSSEAGDLVPPTLGKRQASYEVDFSKIEKRQRVDSSQESTQSKPAAQPSQVVRSDLFKRAQELADRFKSKLVSRNNLSISHGKASLRFTCVNEHNFYMTTEQLADPHLTEWCSKCQAYYEKVQQTCSKLGFHVKGGLYAANI